MKGIIQYDIGAIQGEKLLRMNIVSFIAKGWENVCLGCQK